MALLLKLSWRNLWRNTRRTIITILAVAFATLFSIAMRGIQLGTYEENIAFALNLFSGYAQLQAPGFRENPSLHRSFIFDDQVQHQIQSIDAVGGYAQRVYADGLASFRTTSLGAALFGISPERERTVSRLPGKISAGRFFLSDTSNEVVVGYKLLKNLKAEVGDSIVILAQGFDGTLGNQWFCVVGTVKTGSAEFDNMAIFAGLSRLQDLLVMDKRIQVVALSVTGVDQVENVVENLNATLDTSVVRAIPWEVLMPEMKQSIELDNISGIIFLGILIVVVAFGILNTILMSVTERFREFGVLLSLGMSNRKLVAVVLFETICIAAIGIVAGNVLAVGVNYYLIAHPIQLTGDYGVLMEDYGWLPVIRSSLNIRSFVNTTLSIAIISLLSTLYPLYRTSILEPLKGIRHT